MCSSVIAAGVGRARHPRHGAARPQSSQHHHVEHRQRGPGAGQRGRVASREAAGRISCHDEDPTRPTTAGFNNWTGAIKNKLAEQVDIPGFNYKPMHYEAMLKDHPDWIIFGSETSFRRQFARRLPPAARELSEARFAAGHELRCGRASVGDAARRRVRRSRTSSERAGRVRLDRLRLSRRADAVLRGRGDSTIGPRAARTSASSISPASRRIASTSTRACWTQSADGPHPAALELGRTRRRKDPGHGLLERRRGRIVPERQVPGPQAPRCRGGDIPVGTNVSPDRKFTSKYRMLWEAPFQKGELKAVAYRDGDRLPPMMSVPRELRRASNCCRTARQSRRTARTSRSSPFESRTRTAISAHRPA